MTYKLMGYDKTLTQELFGQDAKEYYRRNYEQPHGRHAFNLSVRRQICLTLVDEGPQSILDLGCGPGALALPLLGAGKRVCGLDLSIEMAKQAALLAEQQANSTAGMFCAGDAVTLPFRNESFDLVTSTGVLEYIPEPERALKEVWRVLKPRGAFIVTASPPRSFETWATDLIARRLLRRYEKSNVWHCQYAPNEFDELLKKARFAIVETRYSYFLPFPLDVVFPSLVQRLDQAVAGPLQQSDRGRQWAKTYIVKARKLN